MKSVEPLMETSPRAVRVDASTITLAKRVIFFPRSSLMYGKDAVISIQVNGREIYKDKAKYTDAKNLGVQGDNFAFFIDKLAVPPDL